MRSIKELLQLMLDNQYLFETGLCFWVWDLRRVNLEAPIISIDECKLLKTYVNKNRPHTFSSFNVLLNCTSRYYWKKGNIKPRIKWIEKHIKLNS